MPHRFLLIRHGESTANAAPTESRVVDAKLTDAYLTPHGEIQARAMGRMLASKFRRPREGASHTVLQDFSPEVVIVSPFTRTIQSACHLTEGWAARPRIIIEPLVREYYPKFVPEITGRPRAWLQACPMLNSLPVFKELEWDELPSGLSQWWSPTGRPDLDTVDLRQGFERMRRFVHKMLERPEMDIVVVGHGTALWRAMKPGEQKEAVKSKGWDNCEARLCVWTPEGFEPIADHPAFPVGGLSLEHESNL